MNIETSIIRKPAAARSVAAKGMGQVLSRPALEEAVALMTRAFAADPVAYWLWPDAETYADVMPRFTRAFSGRAPLHGTADRTACGKGAAFWLPPGVHADAEEVMDVLFHSVPLSRSGAIADFLEQMDFHHPKAPCWYLAQIGVDPAHQGRGLGTALLEYRLALIDAAGESAYLESSSADNLPLYRRHGFEVIGEIRSGSSPVMYPMIRPARG